MTFIINGRKMRLKKSIVEGTKKVISTILLGVVGIALFLALGYAMIENHYRVLDGYNHPTVVETQGEN